MLYIKENISGLLVAIDFKNEFDNINWKFLENILMPFGFEPSFIEWVKTFYRDITSCTMNNGSSSGYFEVRHRKSDEATLFPHICLFLIVTEILAINIRSNKIIEGIRILQL